MNWQCPACAHDNTTARKCSECYYMRVAVQPINLEPQAELLLRHAGDRKVRTVARTESDLSQALFDIAAGDRREWDLTSWTALLERLQACPFKVETWLRRRGLTQ